LGVVSNETLVPVALVVQNDAIYCGEEFKESNFQIFSSLESVGSHSQDPGLSLLKGLLQTMMLVYPQSMDCNRNMTVDPSVNSMQTKLYLQYQ